MIISCSKCGKAYHVDPAELPQAKTRSHQGIHHNDRKPGWFLSCQHCLHEWWFNAPQGFSWYDGGRQPDNYGKTVARTPTKYYDHTDLSGLYAYNPSAAEYDQAYHDRVMQEEYSPFNDVGAFTELPVMHELQEKAKVSTTYKTIILLLVTIISLALAYAFGYFNIIQTVPLVQNGQPLNIDDAQKYFLGLNIQHVQFSSVCEKEGSTLTVTGIILNPSEETKTLPQLKLKAWAACDDTSLVKNLTQGDPYCLVKAWTHNSIQSEIKSKESVPFQTQVSIPNDIKILKIDVVF